VPFWACAALRYHQIQLGVGSLERAGYECYAPRIRTEHNGVALLFVNYVFITIESRWYEIEHTPGVVRIIKADGVPAKVPDRLITELRQREDIAGLITLPAAPKPRGLRPGAKVRIMQGAFRDQFGIYAGQRAHERVMVLLTLLGAQRPLVLPRAAVMPAP
jgi:transcriptional antiterminator RfaH